MENIWLIILVVLLFGGGVVNFVRNEVEGRHRRRREITQGPQPVCGCTDHFSFHEPKTGLCHANRRTATKWDAYGEAVKWEMKQCGCQRYVGPQPLESLYAPEIATGYVQDDQKKEL